MHGDEDHLQKGYLTIEVQLVAIFIDRIKELEAKKILSCYSLIKHEVEIIAFIFEA